MRVIGVMLAAAVLVGGCRESDGPTGPRTGGARVFITSEPSGARIIVDGDDTRQRTPDTVAGFSGEHDVQVRLDTAGVTYEYNVLISVDARDTVVHRVHGPLSRQCAFSLDLTDCYERLHKYRTGADIRFALNPLGSIFLHNGSGGGAFWPSATSNSYMSGGIPVFTALVSGRAVSLGAYDHGYLAGRPAPVSTSATGSATLRQPAWVLPPTRQHLALVATVRGIEIREEITTADNVSGVVLIRLTFRNITDTPEYLVADPVLETGITYTDAYIGLALDPDIGEADDDWLSYDADLDMAFAYDARFAESGFTGGSATAPGLVGLRALRAPIGTTVILNGWNNRADWIAGTTTEAAGFGMLSGRSVFEPAHEHPRIGHLPPEQGDLRLSVTAGPLTLAPGAQAEIVLAVAFAPPATSTFVSGTLVPPGDPLDVGRALYRIAAPLRERMVAAQSLLD
jgi:hypothetical protein